MDLKSAIINYKNADSLHLKHTEEYYKNLKLTEAITNAAMGLSPKFNGKINMDSHQRRIGYKACKAGLKELFKIDKKSPIKKCNSFEEIFKITEKVRKEVDRLGDLWSYDTALRIGFNLEAYPKDIYIQAGVIKGAKKALGKKYNYSRYLPLATFPIEIQNLKPYEAENFLCIWGKDKRKKGC